MKERPTLTAYHLYSGTPSMPLVPAERVRDWMEATPDKFVKRCLPLLIANQAGFVILNSHAITVTWTGGVDKSALHIESGSAGPGLAVSHFGSGVITWNIPWLFRTSEGYNLLVRGPANLPKDGVSALEGVVETDWSCATFTMNWKVTRPGVPIVFAVGEPIALLVPQKRASLRHSRRLSSQLAIMQNCTRAIPRGQVAGPHSCMTSTCQGRMRYGRNGKRTTSRARA